MYFAIFYLPGRGLQPLKRLKVLRLDSNYLHKLDVREITSLSQLMSLDISSNTLEDISVRLLWLNVNDPPPIVNINGSVVSTNQL